MKIQLWLNVRSFSELKAFQKAFRELESDDQAVIVTEMLLFLAALREDEAQGDLFESKEASASREKHPLLRKKRRGRARLTS